MDAHSRPRRGAQTTRTPLPSVRQCQLAGHTHTHTYIHTCTTHTHAHTPTQTHKHPHTQHTIIISNIYTHTTHTHIQHNTLKNKGQQAKDSENGRGPHSTMESTKLQPTLEESSTQRGGKNIHTVRPTKTH